MKKLTDTQTKVLGELKDTVDEARRYEEFDCYWEDVKKPHGMNAFRRLTVVEFKVRYPEAYKRSKKSWETTKSGIVVTGCINSKTLYKLAEMGMIEILEDGKNDDAGIDVVKLLNY